MRPWFLAVTVCLWVFIANVAAAQYYSVVAIGKTSNHASPRALDSSRDIAGVFATASRPPLSHAFFWNKSEGLVDLGTLGGDDSAAFGVNSAGQVVGQSNLSTGAPDVAFLWTATSGMQNLGNLGGTGGAANAINASGQITGQSNNSSGFAHAFLWESTGGMQDLGTLPNGQQSGGNAINSAGEIVGWANIGTVDRAMIWTQADGIKNLGINAACGETAFGINDSGLVVGWMNKSSQCAFVPHGFSWTKSGGAKDLGVLSGGQYSFAYGVNSAGQIVGTGQSATSPSVALFWAADGTLYDLNTLVSTKLFLVAANAINDAGQIIADATQVDGAGNYALLLTPIMEVSLSSSLNPSAVGDSVTFTATVTSLAGPPPDGDEVTFKTGTTILGTGTISAGSATFTTSSLTVGKHNIVAVYDGDSIYASSKSPILVQVVNK